MNPSKVDRQRLVKLTDLPNVGPAMAKDLQLLGISEPAQLLGKDPAQQTRTLHERMHARYKGGRPDRNRVV